jgi:rod shape-determining protein MreC
MDLLHRYRNLMALLAAIVAQLLLLAYQVKNSGPDGQGEVRLIRVWAVTAVTPVARLLETARSSTAHFLSDYFVLLSVREDNKRLKAQLDRVNMENQYLRTELSTADRARSLAIFQERSPLKTVAAHIIGNTTSGALIVDRGSSSGIENGMAVITPDGIVGKIIGAYPTASFVKLVTDQSFAAGVVSQKNRVHGTLRGQGQSTVMIDHIQNEQNVEPGEWFYTSGDDRIFPRGLPVGEVTVARPGRANKEVYVTPSAFQDGLEDVLIVVEGVHMPIPDQPAPSSSVHLEAPPPGDHAEDASGIENSAPIQQGPLSTDADRIIDRYRRIGQAQKHDYGSSLSRAPDFNAPLPVAAPKPAEASQPQGGARPGAAPSGAVAQPSSHE